jgi:hypothetical protein
MARAKQTAELIYIKIAKSINIHTTNTFVSSNTTPAGGMTPSLAAMPTSMRISYASVVNPGITLSIASLLPS